jgi:hypothetical protein
VVHVAGPQHAQRARVAALSARTIPVGRQLLRLVALAAAVVYRRLVLRLGYSQAMDAIAHRSVV